MKRKPAAHAPGPSLGREISIAARAMRALLDSRLVLADTSFATWTVLIGLDFKGPVIQRELAEWLEVEGPTLVRRLDQLEAQGLVRRRSRPGDRRATQVELTDAGQALFRRVRSFVADAEAELFRGLAPGDIETTFRTLRQVIERARSLTKAR